MQWNIKLTTLSSDMNKKKKQIIWAVTAVKNNSIGYNNIATAAALEVVVMLNNKFWLYGETVHKAIHTSTHTHTLRAYNMFSSYVMYAMAI